MPLILKDNTIRPTLEQIGYTKVDRQFETLYYKPVPQIEGRTVYKVIAISYLYVTLTYMSMPPEQDGYSEDWMLENRAQTLTLEETLIIADLIREEV